MPFVGVREEMYGSPLLDTRIKDQDIIFTIVKEPFMEKRPHTFGPIQDLMARLKNTRTARPEAIEKPQVLADGTDIHWRMTFVAWRNRDGIFGGTFGLHGAYFPHNYFEPNSFFNFTKGKGSTNNKPSEDWHRIPGVGGHYESIKPYTERTEGIKE